VDEESGNPPQGWHSWPDGKQFAFVITHDVESSKGQENCYQLMELDVEFGFRSCFNFVAEEFPIELELLRNLTEMGFEVGLHGLKHSGNLFKSEEVFLKQTPRINHYLRQWKAAGFRTPAMYHNLDLLHHLEIEYDSSTFDVDPFEPQPDGMVTIFPFWVQNGWASKGFVELPYTLPQDFTLFILLKEKNIEIWKKKLDWIVEKGGMALLVTHPDYMNYEKGSRCNIGEYPMEYYEEFLNYAKDKYKGQYWHSLPRDIARFWKEKIVLEKGREGNSQVGNHRIIRQHIGS
jgi:peptidoglycan/xylan/chitin deacetylase (PgdA/CDA1 family)